MGHTGSTWWCVGVFQKVEAIADMTVQILIVGTVTIGALFAIGCPVGLCSGVLVRINQSINDPPFPPEGQRCAPHRYSH